MKGATRGDTKSLDYGSCSNMQCPKLRGEAEFLRCLETLYEDTEGREGGRSLSAGFPIGSI